MHRPRLIHLLIISTAVLAACLPVLPPNPPTASAPTFDPTVFFAGHTHGEGALNVRFGARRSLSVDGVARSRPDGTFQLDQTITFANGTIDTRRWVLRRDANDANAFTATLSDAVGEVKAETRGNEFHLRYQIRSPKVFMEQRLYLQPDGRTVLNQAEVTVLGIPWARLSETIVRVEP